MSEAPPPIPSGAPPSAAAKAPNKTAAKKPRRWLRRLLIVLALIPVLVLALWIAIHRVGWLGPWLADTGRAIVGNDAIAKLEDWAYGVQDKFNTTTRGDEKPKALWVIPPRATAKPVSSGDADPSKAGYPAFEVKDVGAMLESFSAPGDGQWVPMPDPRKADEPAPMFKTLLHPDPKRGWASVAVVAVDMRQVELHLKAGTMEPMTKLKDAKDHKRTGLISPDDLGSAIAVFNGGFKTTHGNYGMKAEGVLWVEPHGRACTIAQYPDKLLIRSWEELESTEPQMVWFRETPMCMYELGEMHKGLTVENNTHWGATLDKDTVIRRSAIGLSEDGQTLYVGISEATTATAIAKAMHFAGSYNVAQLDVNWSYPKFFTVEPRAGGSSEVEVKPIVPGFEFSPDDYIRRETTRDFFYITRLALPLSARTPAH